LKDIGVIPQTRRSECFIKLEQGLGFALEEITGLLRLDALGACAETRELAARKLALTAARVRMVVGDIGPTHNALMFASGPTWPASKFYEIGTRGMPVPTVPSWMPSFQENKSAAGQGRGEITYHSDGPVPIGKWFLLEWELNDNPSAITVWIDGEKVVTTFNNEKIDTVKFEWPKGSGTVNGLIGGFQEVGFGARVWGANAAEFDVYYDDIAIGATRIGPAR
jgi:hypothetical protein